MEGALPNSKHVVLGTSAKVTMFASCSYVWGDVQPDHSIQALRVVRGCQRRSEGAPSNHGAHRPPGLSEEPRARHAVRRTGDEAGTRRLVLSASCESPSFAGRAGRVPQRRHSVKTHGIIGAAPAEGEALDLELSERVAIVTGASAGIGRAIAAVLAAEGARTVIVARRGALLASLAEEIEAHGGPRPMLVEADLYDPQVPPAIARDVLARHGRIDVLVNSAGGSRPMSVDADDAAWDEAFALNFSAARRLAQAVLPTMRRARWGRIINITGSVEPRSVNGAGVAKAAVHAWAKGLAVDVAAEGITVNCLGPGRIHSEQIDQRLHPTAESRLEFVRANIPIGYFGDPTDMAYPVVFLCSPKARYITGQRVYVDGGMSHGI